MGFVIPNREADDEALPLGDAHELAVVVLALARREVHLERW